VALLLIILASLHGAVRLEPSFRDYAHTAWTQHDGVPLSSVVDITQTTDGYLWVTTTEAGLLRFDGVRFVPAPSPCGRPQGITQAQSDRAGGLWILCDYHLFRRDASGRVTAVKQTVLPAELRPAMSLFVDSHGRLWLWGRSLSYLRADGSQGPPIPGTERALSATYCRFAEDSEGNIWFANLNGLMRIRDDRAERVLTGGSLFGLEAARSGGIYAIRDGSLLHIRAGSTTTVSELGSTTMPTPGGDLKETEHGIWLGTQNSGLALIRRGRVETFGREEGLSSNAVRALEVDREGAVWVGTALGLHRFRAPLAHLMSQADGMPPGMPRFVYHDRRNGLWIGTGGRTVRIDADSGRSESAREGLHCIHEDKPGRIWVSGPKEFGYLHAGRFVNVPDSAGESIPNVFSIVSDAGGKVRALSTTSGIYRIVEGKAIQEIASDRFSGELLVSDRGGLWISLRGSSLLHRVNGTETIYGPETGLAGGGIHTLFEDHGSIWVGSGSGLARWRNGKWTTWTAGHGLPGRGDIYEITTDAQNRFWLMSDGGILVLSRSQLEQTPDGKPGRLTYLRIGALDRVMPHRGGQRPSPRVSKDRNGRLFFATYDSIAIVDPTQIAEGSFMPPIVLESVLINRRPVDQAAASRFVKPEDVQFEYTSLSLRNPENVRFRYLLENHDMDWIDAGTQRRASYSSLRPGSYRFRVIGSGSEGVWNEAGVAYTFQIVAPFYQTPWFVLAALALTATLVWLAHRYRMRLAAAGIRMRMEAQAGERLRIAQEMHDTFLQGIQGSALMVHAAAEKLESEPSETRRLLERALQMVQHSTDEARQMLSSLRSVAPTTVSLTTRLQSLAAQEAALYPGAPAVSIKSSGQARELRAPVDEDVYRIASEALKNALRHARARQIQMEVRFEPRKFELLIADDGVGMAPDIQKNGRASHFGLHGMRERAERHSGSLRIKSQTGRGTELLLSLAGKNAYRSDPER
jgi:signal transduction histidine kinase/ligand-binding sensor domain-containing protein